MKIEIDTKDIIQGIVNDLDYDRFLDVLYDDIERDNPDWWTKQIVKHIEKDILKLIQTKDFCENMVNYLLENTDIEEDIIKEATNKIVENIELGLPKPTVVWSKE